MDTFLMVYGGLFLTLIGFIIGAAVEGKRAERDAAKKAAEAPPPEKPCKRLVEVFVMPMPAPDAVVVETLQSGMLRAALDAALITKFRRGEIPAKGAYLYRVHDGEGREWYGRGVYTLDTKPIEN